MRVPRPSEYDGAADAGLQQERTALAWERTAISMMAAGVLLSRFAATDHHPLLAGFGLLQSVLGALVLVWAGLHYSDLHGPVRSGDPIVHPAAARVLGLGTVLFSGVAFVLAVLHVSA